MTGISKEIAEEMAEALGWVHERFKIPANQGKINRCEFLAIEGILSRLGRLNAADEKEHQEWRHYVENFAKPGSTRLNGEPWSDFHK